MELLPTIKEMIEMKVERAWELIQPEIGFSEAENEVSMLLWEVLHYTGELDKKREEHKRKLIEQETTLHQLELTIKSQQMDIASLQQRLKYLESLEIEDWDPFAEDEDDNLFGETELIEPLKLDDEGDDQDFLPQYEIDMEQLDKDIKKYTKRKRKKKS